jgi:hypothetical protein
MTLGMPKYSYQLMGDGKLIGLPISGPAGVLSAILFYGVMANSSSDGTPDRVPIKLVLKSDATLLLANAGNVARVGGLNIPAAEFLHAAFFPKQFVRARAISLQATIIFLPIPQLPPAAPAIPEKPAPGVPVVNEACQDEYEACLLLADMVFWNAVGWSVAACACIAVALAAARAKKLDPSKTARALIAACAFAVGAGAIANIESWLKIKDECERDFRICLGLPPLPPEEMTKRPAEGIQVKEVQVDIQLEP